MDPLPLLKQLIAIPSVNPMGRAVEGPEYLEGRVSDFLCEQLKSLGIDYERREIAPGRANILARCEAGSGAPVVLLDAHQDTVPVDGMTISPFEPFERDGKLYGRGSCDVKGGLATMFAAFVRLVKEQPAGRATVVLSMTCDEEATSIGIHDLCGSWHGKAPPYRLCPKKPDVAVVAEPTELQVVVAHRGALRWKIRVGGVACHSSRPQDGVNAIYRMAKVVNALEEFADYLPGSVPAHPLCGPATLSVGLIEGGASVNVVPDHCTVDIDRRMLPGESSESALETVRAWIAERVDFPFEFLPSFCNSAALSEELSGPWSARLQQVLKNTVGPRERIGVAYGTHASRTAAAGVPSVVCGPGDIAQAHTKDEWIEIRQLGQAVDAYYNFCVAAGQGPLAS
ncbi:MAG: M20 family metallopeptidase [Planctomycetaceae bacterium]|nr:M20 family metallopeptidase [Planctomycetaceae bacterium]